MPEISVLVPVFNGEKTIQKSIQSILDQTFSDFELIVIDDGSFDNTQNIIHAINDSRLRYVYKENGGIGHTRNTAVSLAKGNYIAFLDADDWMEPNALEKFFQCAQRSKADMVVADYRFVYPDGTKQDMHTYDFNISNMKARKSLLVEVMPQPWNKLVKKEVLKNSGLQFPDGHVFEDLCYYSCLLPSVSSVAKLDDVLINYVQFDTSIMASAKKIKPTIYDFNKVVQIIYQYYQNHQLLTYSYELEGLFALNARELIDGVFKNEQASRQEKIKVVEDILKTINTVYPKWYRNSYYREKFVDFGSSFRLKRWMIDYFLAKGKTKFVIEKILK